MSATSISSPYPIFTESDGTPLESGYIYIGTANANPETSPISVYWDAALSIPASQPIRTLGGYPIYNGSPGRIYANSNYSITVKDKNEELIVTSPVSTDEFGIQISSTVFYVDTLSELEALSINYGVNVGGRTAIGDGYEGLFVWKSGDQSSNVTNDTTQAVYVAPLSDATGASGAWKRAYSKYVYPTWFGVVGDGITDDTTAWAAFIAFDGNKIIPSGEYLVSSIVKTYKSSTFINVDDNNHSAGYLALESSADSDNNTAIGYAAMQNTNGSSPLGCNNVAVGTEALMTNTEGYRNVAVGYQSLYSNIGTLTTGNSNSALGYQSLYYNDVGKDNTAIGYLSMFYNTEGGGNCALGYRTLYNNIGVADTTGQFNVAIGYESMLDNTYGNSNTSVGWRGLFSNTTGVRNTCLGQEALRSNDTTNNNVAIGYQAAYSTIGSDNVAVGYFSLWTNTTGTINTATGKESLYSNTTGASNSAFGYQALYTNSTGSLNAAVGRNALKLQTVSGGTAIGYNAGSDITTGTYCTALGYNSLTGNSTYTNCTGVGANTAVTAANQVQLGDSATTTYAYGAVQDRSDARDKLDIKSLTDAHIAFFMDVEWKQFRMNYRERYDGENDGSKAGKRFHIGAIAQQVDAAMKKHGVDFAGLQHHAVAGGEDVYTIGYQEFIGLQGEIIQRQHKSISAILSRLDSAGI